jgi:hypothetical protein
MDITRFPQAWNNDSELALMKEDFYPEKTPLDPYAEAAADRRQSAIDLVAAYLFKDPTTPHAVVATANLTEGSLHDNQRDQSLHISDNAMRSIYAMAFVKFVNGFVDRDVAKANTAGLINKVGDLESENPNSFESGGDDETEIRSRVKGGGESSMYAYADKVNMPEDFVDLRHSIVHGEIPSLDMLRIYNKRALEWLWEKWWSRNIRGDSGRAKAACNAQQELAKYARERSRESWERSREDTGRTLEQVTG